MPLQNHASDAVHWHMNELTSQVVALSGIVSDRFHLGKIMLQSLKNAPDFVLHIDGATGETETFQSGLKRSVQCATAFRMMGLKTHDVIIVMAPNHIHMIIPIYAALYLGIAVAGIDMTLGVGELGDVFNNILPKVIFCQNEKANDVLQALKNVNLEALIVTYNDSDNFPTFSNVLKSADDVSVADFKASDFDPETTVAMLLSTSGTSGVPKCAAMSHKNWVTAMPYYWLPYNNFPMPFNMHLVVSPIQWLSALTVFISSPIMRFIRLQTSSPVTQDHFYELVNKYRPSSTLGSPNFFLHYYKAGCQDKCDLTCIGRIIVGGSAVPPSLVADIKAASLNTRVHVSYGLSEVAGFVFDSSNSVNHSVGVPMGSMQYRLVNPETLEDINEPNLPGELWLKSPSVFMGYYNNPKMTEEAKTKDGWIKTGDILYRDERWNFFFVERLKMLLKYMNHQISPVEIEAVIINHPGVYDVAVTGIPDKERGDLPLACIVLNEGYDVTAEEIKDIVKEALTDSKQLRGGVIFMKELPMTATSKVNRAKLASMVLEMKKEKKI